MAHNQGVVRGGSLLARLVPAGVKGLAQIRVAMRVGCPF